MGRHHKARSRRFRVTRNIAAVMLVSEILSTGVVRVGFDRPKVTFHPHPTSSHLVVILPATSNFGTIVTRDVVPKLQAKGAHVMVGRYAWGDFNSYDIYKAVVGGIEAHNRQPGTAKIKSISFLGSSLGGAVAIDLAWYFLQDGLPYGKVGITLSGSFCTAADVKRDWAVKYGGYVMGGVFTTLLKLVPSYWNSSRALDDIEPGLGKAHLRRNHASMGLFPMPGLAAQARYIRDYSPPPDNIADGISKAVFISTPNDPLVDNISAARCWKIILPELMVVTAEWGPNRHAPMAEEPTLQAKHASLSFP